MQAPAPPPHLPSDTLRHSPLTRPPRPSVTTGKSHLCRIIAHQRPPHTPLSSDEASASPLKPGAPAASAASSLDALGFAAFAELEQARTTVDALRGKIIALEGLVVQAFGRIKREEDVGDVGEGEVAAELAGPAKYELPGSGAADGAGGIEAGVAKVEGGEGGGIDHDFVAELLSGAEGYARESSGGELLEQEGLREEEVAASLSLEFLGK